MNIIVTCAGIPCSDAQLALLGVVSGIIVLLVIVVFVITIFATRSKKDKDMK
jgi:heme/copper-type cytochrome/quinol oxidase subunit 2